MLGYIDGLRAAYHFRGYRPQPVTLQGFLRWIRQFESKDHTSIVNLLRSVIYLSESRVRSILVEQNRVLMRRLEGAGLRPDQLIYVQVHEAGSSSPVMLNMLRDAAGLEQRGCQFLDSRDALRLNKLTAEMEEGALIYVDDFVGTGDQFCESRDFTAGYIEGNFSEFLLVPCICEEGLYTLGARGIEAFAGHVHSKAERPLHENSMLFDKKTKTRLIEICRDIDASIGVGYQNGAVMIVLYRNAPDNVPVLLRGSNRQAPFVGIFPRTTDLPLADVD